ncbi:MAG: DNA-processing protein DprA, partial [Planctomycetia bacterium]|nr:DNA-processing protein DprA [Planctomycetia bacterium]
MKETEKAGNEKKSVQERRRYEPEEIRDEILLSFADGIGSLMTRRLMNYFSSASSVLAAPEEELTKVGGVGPKLANHIRTVRNKYNIDDVINVCRREEIDIICQEDQRYPESLLRIPDPPVLLYQRGEILPEDTLSLSVVGTRGL